MSDRLKNLVRDSLPEIIGGIVVAIVIASASTLFSSLGIWGILGTLAGLLSLVVLTLLLYRK